VRQGEEPSLLSPWADLTRAFSRRFFSAEAGMTLYYYHYYYYYCYYYYYYDHYYYYLE